MICHGGSQVKWYLSFQVVLEKVLGITTSSSSGLACNPNSGLVAYPAGCVVVILHPKRNNQNHILNISRKTFTALAFSQDGKYLVTGESGHMPCVRVWDVAERTQVAEVQCHKYGVACVAFSTNSSYIVSVGYQHDQTVSVWEWRKGTVIASNKVSSRVLSVSFSEDNSYFVTAGNRHVKFWYLDASKERRVNSTVPLIGRSGLLGEQRNRLFCGLACGRGSMASSTYCITSSGLLCQFNSRRLLDAWVDLKTSSARCLSVSDRYVFCGCADGTVRVFNPQNLHYITTLHRPHSLGVDITQGLQSGHPFASSPEAEFPDTIALAFDPITHWLTCVYHDHSLYVWDVRDMRNVGKVYSALYHSNCVWSVETYPHVEEPSKSCLHPGSFLTCSSDNTIRLWHIDPQHNQSPSAKYGRNLYSRDLMKIVYVGKDTQHLQHEWGEGGSIADVKSGIRVLKISPDGQHLAAGDRNGNLHLQFLDELLKIEAHDSEVLCLEFSPLETGLHLLASASRDRLIHVFNMEKDYSLEQTVYDHSASITAIRFTGDGSAVHMVSCGADKSIYFRTAEKSSEGLTFSRSHHVVEKATLYDMDLDSSCSHTVIACQDRNIRVYNVKSGKMKKCFKGSLSDDGTLLKVQMDPSGMFLATSCSDKNISIFDYESGECVATLFGHSEIVTGMKFSQDCRHLITVSGDSCVFVWRLDSQMTNSMRKRLADMTLGTGLQGIVKCPPIRRQTYITVPSNVLEETAVDAEEEEGVMSEEDQEEDPRTPARDESSQDDVLDAMFLQTNGKLPMWARRLGAAGLSSVNPAEQAEVIPYQPRGRWAEQSDPQAIRSVLETRSLQLPLSPSPRKTEGCEDEEDAEEDSHFHPQSLDSLLVEENDNEEFENGKKEVTKARLVPGVQRPNFLSLPESEELFSAGLGSPETSDYILYPANSTALSTAGEGEFDVREQCEARSGRQQGGWGEEELSPDSACCVGSAESQVSTQDADTDSLSQVSSTGSSGMEDDEEEPETLLRRHFDTLADNLVTNEKFNTDLRELQPSNESIFLNPRLSISARFLSRFQSRTKLIPSKPFSNDTLLESAPQDNSKNREITNRNQLIGSHSQRVPAPVLDEEACLQKMDMSRSSKDSLQTQLAVRPSQQSYMCTTASSRAKMSRSYSLGEKLNVSSTEEQSIKLQTGLKVSSVQDLSAHQDCKENFPPPARLPAAFTASTTTISNSTACGISHTPISQSVAPAGNHSARVGLHLDLSRAERTSETSTSPLPLKLRRRTVDLAHLSALTTPTEMRSLGKEEKNYISSIEEKLTPQSPVQLTNFPGSKTSKTLHSSTSTRSQFFTASSLRGVEKELFSLPQKSGSLHLMEDNIEQLQHMKSVLTDAFLTIQTELDSVCTRSLYPSQKASCLPAEESPGRQLKDDRTMALLEKYSEMLLRIAEKKMDCN
ncbi:WD repeat-containing protein 62-like [Scleropages formosus]|uniref:WD repeat-containing protein 62-like n=1 Tax=Scleropages formosus TaxID=113540 RepID=A0A0P7U645_SCLFO|nr:WD repeat-containing protein 62-like [Scleropages formosus]